MKLRLLALGCLLFSLTSCFDVIETFNLKEDGSGNYEVKTDMSNALSMLAMMGGGKESEKMPEKFDTSFSFKGMADTVSTLTAEEKAAIDKISARMHIDKDKGEMYMIMDMPFKDSKEYNLVQAAFQKMNSNEKSPMDGLFKGMFGGGNNPMAEGDEQDSKKGGGTPGIMPSNVETLMTANSISRKVKPVAQTETTKTPEDMPEELKEMFKMNYTTIVNLPRPAKNVKGAGKLSDDKKQVKSTKKIDLSSGFTAADFDFTIDF
jgi:hypothetical protein